MKALTGAALALFCLAGAARAQPPSSDVDCVWSATTEPMRQAMHESLRDHGGITDGLTSDQANALMRACRMSNTGTSAQRLSAILRGRMLTLDAEQGLGASLGVPPEALAAAWRRMPPANRRALTGAFDHNFEMTEALNLALGALAAPLGISTEPDRNLFFEYAVGRALLDAIGAR